MILRSHITYLDDHNPLKKMTSTLVLLPFPAHHYRLNLPLSFMSAKPFFGIGHALLSNLTYGVKTDPCLFGYLTSEE